MTTTKPSFLSAFSPEFIFLQLYQSSILTPSLQRPIKLPNTASIVRGLQILDNIPAYNTCKIGIVYVRPGQGTDGTAILQNQHGSSRYHNMLNSLGNLVRLDDCDATNTYLGKQISVNFIHR